MAEGRLIKKGPRNPSAMGSSDYMYQLENAARKDHTHQYTTPRITLPYQNSFTTFSVNTRELSLYTIGNLVRIEGVIKRSTTIGPSLTPLTITNIPIAYRPTLAPVFFLVSITTTVVVAGIATLQLNANGDLDFNVPDWMAATPAALVNCVLETCYYVFQ